MTRSTSLFCFASLVLLLLLLSGCSGRLGTGSNVPQLNVPTLREGKEGLILTYLQDLPPKQVIAEQDFIIGLELYNAGATVIENGVYVIGYESHAVSLPAGNTGTFYLPGKSFAQEYGVKDHAEIPVHTKSLPAGLETYTTTFTTTACYPYESVADLIVCLDPKPYDDTPKVCTNGAVTFSRGQGGPVAVTRIENRLANPGTEGTPRFDFTITIRNEARGQVVSPLYTFNQCEPAGSPSSALNNLTATITLGGKSLNCILPGRRAASIDMPLTLQKDFVELRCTYDAGLPLATAFTAPLRVNLEYGYSTTQTTQVQIRRPGS